MKRILVLLLCLCILASAGGGFIVQGANDDRDKKQTVSVPAISSPFTTHPTVFVVEDTYQIAFATNGTGLAWAEVGGTKYYDSTNGLMNWNSKYHKVTVPREIMDGAGSYKICFRSLSSRPTYNPTPGSEVSRTYPFDPVPEDRDPVFYCSSDQHGTNDNCLKISKTKDFDVYVFGGDYVSSLTEESQLKTLLDMTGSVTQGRKPTIYTRGNHELRGSKWNMLDRVTGYSEETGPYYTVRLPGIFGIVLDVAEPEEDTHEMYGGTIVCDAHREAETQWLRSVVLDREWEKYPIRMVFCHVPFTMYAKEEFETVFKEWTELLDEMGVSLFVGGHNHWYGVYGPDHTKHLSDPNFTVLLVSDRANSSYTYSGTFVTVDPNHYKIENVSDSLSVKSTKTVPVFTNAYVDPEAGNSQTLTRGEEAEVSALSAVKASVPAITSPYVLHPTVFAIEDGYQIVFTTDTTGLAGLVVGDHQYFDHTTGMKNWDSKYHSIFVPREILDTARSYKIYFRPMSSCPAYHPSPGSANGRTYPFTPMSDKKEPVILSLSDFRGFTAEAKAVAGYQNFDALYIGGDYAYNGDTEANVRLLLDVAGAITSGTKPVIFTRGNREIRGNYSYLLDKIAPTSRNGKSYYTIEQSDFFGIVLDSGEDKLDSHADHGGTVDYESLRKEQTQWLRRVLAEGKWKEYPTRIAFCHIPLTMADNEGIREDYAQWTELLNQMGISLLFSGHYYTHSLYAPGHSSVVSQPNFPTMISSSVDKTDYKYSGTFVTLGTKTITMENVSNDKKLLKTTTTANLTAPRAPQESDPYLFFDFNNDSVAADRYHSFVYGGLNFDLKSNWAQETNTSARNISNGVLSFSPANGTATSFGVYSRPLGTSGGQWAHHPLHYFNKGTDYCQIRFKIDNAVATTSEGTAIFRLDVDCPNDINSQADATKYHTRFEQSFRGEEVIDRGFVTLTFPLETEEYKRFDYMDLVHPQFVNLKSAEGKTAVFSIDYIYIGPSESLPSQEDCLYFDFTDTEEDRERYSSFTYNQLNFDDPSNWRGYNGSPMSTIRDGALCMAVPTGNTDTSHSLRTNRDGVKVLHYVPGEKDVLRVRIQIRNAQATSSDGMAEFVMYLDRCNSVASSDGTVRTWTPIPFRFPLSEYTDRGWFTLELPLTETEYLESDWINMVHVQFRNMKSASGKNAEFLMDYIYIGPEEKDPNAFTVTFRGEMGEFIEEHRVLKGNAVAYNGELPLKAYDENCHYSFASWVDEEGQPVHLGTVMGNLELHPSFTAEDHSYTDGVCICGRTEAWEPVEDPSFKLSHSLNLASDISVNLAVPKTMLEGFDMDTVYVESRIEGQEGEGRPIRIEPVETDLYYYFTLDGLTAVQMNDQIRSVLYGTKDGQPYYSPVDAYSIAQYAYSQLDNPDRPESLKILCADLLRYGSKAQIFKSYRTDALDDTGMTETHRSFLTDMETVVFGNNNRVLDDLETPIVRWEGKSLDLASKVCVKFIFSIDSDSVDVADLTLRVSYENVRGERKQLSLTNGELYNTSYGFYAFTLDSLLAAELRSVVSVQVYEGDRPVSCTLEYGADTYGNNKTGNLLELCKALFAYSDSAKDYFMS